MIPQKEAPSLIRKSSFFETKKYLLSSRQKALKTLKEDESCSNVNDTKSAYF